MARADAHHGGHLRGVGRPCDSEAAAPKRPVMSCSNAAHSSRSTIRCPGSRAAPSRERASGHRRAHHARRPAPRDERPSDGTLTRRRCGGGADACVSRPATALASASMSAKPATSSGVESRRSRRRAGGRPPRAPPGSPCRRAARCRRPRRSRAGSRRSRPCSRGRRRASAPPARAPAAGCRTAAAIATFCWLPPLSERMPMSTSAALTWKLGAQLLGDRAHAPAAKARTPARDLAVEPDHEVLADAQVAEEARGAVGGHVADELARCARARRTRPSTSSCPWTRRRPPQARTISRAA